MVKPNSEKIRDFEIAYQHTCHTLCNTRLKREPKLQSKLKINNKQKKNQLNSVCVCIRKSNEIYGIRILQILSPRTTFRLIKSKFKTKT
jgi:hypothetical protein